MELKTAQALATMIRESVSPTCVRLEIAGSIRREKPEVKDIELVAVVEDYDKAFSALTQFGKFIKPGVPDIIPWPARAGGRYYRMLLNEGVKLDFFVASPKNWGGVFAMRTGSATGPDGNPFQGFIPGMYKRWKKISGGGRMTEALPTYPTGEQISLPEEEDFFKVLQVQWVHPSERVSSKVIKPL